MEHVQGTTLVIIDENKRGVICRCKVCGHEDVYDKKYLLENSQECRYCKRLKQIKNNKDISDNIKVNILLKEEELRNSGNLKPLKAGRNYIDSSKKQVDKFGNVGDNMQVIGVVGVWDENGKTAPPTDVAVLCTTCGVIRLYKIPRGRNISVKYLCTYCADMKKWVETDRRSKLEQYKNQGDKDIDKESKNEVSSQGSKLDEMKKQQARIEEKFKKSNPDHYVRVDFSTGELVVSFACKRCGYMEDIKSPSRRYKLTDCPGCEKLLTKKDYVGLLKQNLVGRIYNGMEIIKQYEDPEKGYLCDIKCGICGEKNSIIKGVHVIDVTRKKYWHTCDYFKVEHICIACKTVNNFSIKDINTKTNFECDNCGTKVDPTDLTYAVNEYDQRLSFNKARKKLEGTTDLPKMNANEDKTLFYEETPVYRSEGRDYYRCICGRHGRYLVLNNSEITNYNCEKCNDLHESMFKFLNPRNIKIKGNERIL